ncbi:helix-turn-helix domain-containing protein [Streptomyces sp. NPDC004647]|uniref:PucR family transcriptional regulator n=1 Tax=Streptomyces sp. NPDC004647 TaxID=3154671 RepID=UPI0033B4B6B8
MQPVVRTRVRARSGLPTAASPVRSLAGDAADVLHGAARVLLNDLPQLTDRLVAALREQEPAFRAAVDAEPDEVRQQVHRSLRHSIGALLGPRERADAARRFSWQLGGDLARQGLPLDALQHAFRLGGSMIWQALVDVAGRRDPDDVRLLVHVAADIWDFVDEHCTIVAGAYRQVERQVSWRRQNRLRLMAGSLLDGTTRIADLPEVAAALELPEEGRYAVVAVAGGNSRAYGGAQPPRTPPGLRVLWHSEPDAAHGIVLIGEGSVTELGRALRVPPGGRIGISSAVEGLASLGEARRLAETALRSCPGGGGPALLDEHLPAALVVSSPALGTALADRVLGPLLRLEPNDRATLLETLTAWLECDGSAQRTGNRLYCHRNTVLNRLRRYEQLSGRSLGRPGDVVELSLALAARRLLHV